MMQSKGWYSPTRSNLLASAAVPISQGMSPAGHTTGITADINADGRIGLAEVIYILQIAAGLR